MTGVECALLYLTPECCGVRKGLRCGVSMEAVGDELA
jgi:hypothetical protein